MQLLRRYNALNKHIVSFGAAKCKRNTRSTLAVIFIPKNRMEFHAVRRKDGTYGKSKVHEKLSRRV